MSECSMIPSPQAAAILGVKPQSLRRWRVRGNSPEYIRSGSRVFYRASVLQAWLEAHTFSSTSEETASTLCNGSCVGAIK